MDGLREGAKNRRTIQARMGFASYALEFYIPNLFALVVSPGKTGTEAISTERINDAGMN